jgi:hypothetical protein
LLLMLYILHKLFIYSEKAPQKFEEISFILFAKRNAKK